MGAARRCSCEGAQFLLSTRLSRLCFSLSFLFPPLFLFSLSLLCTAQTASAAMSQDALLSIVHGTESTCIPVDKWMSATKGTGLSEAEAVPKSENAGPITWRLRIKADDIKWSVLSGIILFLKTDQPFPIGKQADVESVLRLAQRFQMQAVTDACERGMLDPRGQKIVKLGQAFAFAYNFKLNRLREECERTAVYAKDMQDCSLFDAHHPSARKDNAASASAAAGSTADDGCCSSLGWCIFIALLALAAGFGVREYVRRQHVLMERDVAGRIEDALEHQVVKVKEQAMQEAVLKTVQDIEFLSCPPHLFVVEMLYQSGHVVVTAHSLSLLRSPSHAGCLSR